MAYTKLTSIEKAFSIDGYPDYFIGDDKKLYRMLKSGGIRENKLIMVGYTKGYILKSKFISQTRLQTLLKPIA